MSRDDVLFRAWRNKDASGGVDVGRNSTREIYFRLDIGVCRDEAVCEVVDATSGEGRKQTGDKFFGNFIDPSSVELRRFDLLSFFVSRDGVKIPWGKVEI